MSEVAVRTHAINVRSCAMRVRSTASAVESDSGGIGAPSALLAMETHRMRPAAYFTISFNGNVRIRTGRNGSITARSKGAD